MILIHYIRYTLHVVLDNRYLHVYIRSRYIYTDIPVCVCVNHLKRCKTSNLGFLFNAFYKLAGGSGRSLWTATNEDTHLIWWYRLGRQSAYLDQFSFPVHGFRLSQEPAHRFSCVFSVWKGKVQFPIWSVSALAMALVAPWYMVRSLQRPTLVRCNWSVFARKMHSATQFAMTLLSKCVSVCIHLCVYIYIYTWHICIHILLILKENSPITYPKGFSSQMNAPCVGEGRHNPFLGTQNARCQGRGRTDWMIP